MKISFGQILVVGTILLGIIGLGFIIANKSNDIEAKYRETVDVFALAKDLGLNVDQFKKDIDSQAVKDKVTNDKEEATTRLNGEVYTPAIFIDGQVYQMQTLGDLETKLDELVKTSTKPILVEEFFDFNCPHCYEFEPIVMQIENKFGDKIDFEQRYLPFLKASSTTYAQAAEAAKKQGKFRDYTQELFIRIHGDQGILSSPIQQ